MNNAEEWMFCFISKEHEEYRLGGENYIHNIRELLLYSCFDPTCNGFRSCIPYMAVSAFHRKYFHTSTIVLNGRSKYVQMTIHSL
ncbi:hypothetical protein MA16_Dca029104 [Dendrobium catenatum]|uniref:Uncharacterized protein n=1 Tax=Dendrobium catenatum TaxID=906689 RepID=A0A2I0VC31_9ASPA|nr:hypothetical protein MA16_Dca029104 [Dendrobium catenatum]